MNLVVFGTRSRYSLLKMINSTFSRIPNTNNKPTSYNSCIPPFTNRTGKVIIYRSAADRDKLTLYWQTPCVMKYPNNVVTDFILRYLNHQGEGSIFKYLQERRLATKVVANVTTADNFCIIQIQIYLTESGFIHRTVVIQVVFELLAKIRVQSVKDMKNYWKNFVRVSQISFEYGLLVFPGYLM